MGRFLTSQNQQRGDHRHPLCAAMVAIAAPVTSILKTPDKQQVSDNIDNACDSDEQERKIGVADTAEDTADYIIRDDDQNTAGTDTDISDCLVKRFRRYLQKMCDVSANTSSSIVAMIPMITNSTMEGADRITGFLRLFHRYAAL